MFKSYFPLRWESTGDQWWYASPIDWAAANGHYDIVRELLYLDANLLIKLTSLRRIRRLETLWDDDARFADAARCRAFVARNLLLECETKNRNNTLLRAGYGGWLLYTAASAGDAVFVKELVDRDPLLVFGEGEYGVSDILYGAARSKNSEVFTRLLDCAMRPKGLVGVDDDDEEEEEEEEGLSRDGKVEVFRWEMVNRAVHAAARGGSLEVLRQLVSSGGCDVLTYRDAQGSTILHAASGKGQVEVANYLVSSFDIINSRDDQGNTALHIAAFCGHSSVVKALITAHPESSTIPNNAGDTFLHMAVAGFRTPGFRRLDRQMELMHHLVKGSTINIQEIINIKNNDGRTALHVAVTGNMHSDLVELLMTVRRIDLNIRDVNGMTPLDLLSRQPRSASSEILIKQLISAGGIFTPGNRSVVSAIASHLKMQSIGSSPGTNFKVSDAEIFLYTGIEAREQTSSCTTSSKECSAAKKQNSVNTAAKKLKLLLKWPLKKEKVETTPKKEHSVKRWSECEDTPTPLRQRFAKTSMLNSKRAFCVRSSSMPPSPATKKKFTAGLMHGVIQAMPSRTQSDSFSMSGMSTPTLEKEKDFSFGEEIRSASCSKSLDSGRSAEVMEKSCQRQDSVKNDNRLMNRYLCFGAQGLAVENSVRKQRRSGRIFKGSVISAA